IESILENMGQDGAALVTALGKANNKQFKAITDNLLKTAGIARATLADFNKQVNASTKTNAQFASDLQKLAASGYGDLAQALAAQGDDAAVALAHQAAGSSKGAASANKAVKANAATLTGTDLTNALTLLSTLKGKSGAGIADVIAAGLDWPTIAALAPKIASQIKSVPGYNAFVQQVKGQGIAMAQGGILNAPTVLAGERGPEAYIPLNNSARSRGILSATAAAFGSHVVPASRFTSGGYDNRPVVREGDRITNITLNGAKQSSAEQAADLVRHLSFVR
ncbi:MAG: phage tail tape measure protein, partial [Streptosporangiaceae bacterium]|nr:phage tail tape measure protein [Streptosporangiaceae bacterium]